MSTARFTTCPKIFPACCTTETDASVSPENATGNWFRWASFTSLPEAPFIRSISETALLRSRAITSAKSGGSAPDTGQENPEDRVDDAQLHGFRNRACTPEMDKPYIPFFSIRIFPIGNICLSSSLLTIITERYGKEAEGQPFYNYHKTHHIHQYTFIPSVIRQTIQQPETTSTQTATKCILRIAREAPFYSPPRILVQARALWSDSFDTLTK